MANEKPVAVKNTIVELSKAGRSQRQIARELGIDRETVGRHLRLWRQEHSNPAIPTAGNRAGPGPNPAISTTGTSGRVSLCEIHRKRIEEALEDGLSAQRIYQDLVHESGFGASYESVKRFVRKLRQVEPRRFHRLECLPGEEAQVDFGAGPGIRQSDGRLRKSWFFRIVLSHSRKGYTEAVHNQCTETFIRCLENAFRYFGGVPQMLVTDNLKAAVNRADWYDPELNPKIEAFARHYGTVVLPTRARHPHHNGKVENSVGYVKANALKGRRFESLRALNEHLGWWEEHVADQRIHGTTRRQVHVRFAESERAALGPLAPMPFPCFQEARRQVHRDGHVEVAKAYYEVPEEYLGREVWARWDASTVRVFNQRLEQIAIHARLESGCFSAPRTTRGRACGVERSSGYYRNQAALLGTACGQWACLLVDERGVAAIRPLQGLLALTKEHSSHALNRACAEAVASRALRLRDVRRLLEQPERQDHFEFIDQHPLIRELDVYGQFVEHQTQEHT